MQRTFEKPKGLKYTDLAIYVDLHEPELGSPDIDPKIEDTVYSYIYLICHALATKAHYFGRNEHIYDDFALYMASNVYMVLIKRRKAYNAGKMYHEKPILPVKSVLNYIKATIYPFKVDYQQETYREIVNTAMADDTSLFKEKMEEGIQSDYRGRLIDSFSMALDEIGDVVEQVMQQTPFRRESLMKHKLKASICLTLLDQITLPQTLKKKITNRNRNTISWELSLKFMKAHETVGRPARLWHLDPSFANYVNVLTAKTKTLLSQRTQEYIHGSELTSSLVAKVIDTAYATYDLSQGED